MRRGTAGARGGTRDGAGPSGSPVTGVIFTLPAVGVVHTPFHQGCAIPNNFEHFARGTVEMFFNEPPALSDLLGGDLVWLITYCPSEGRTATQAGDVRACDEDDAYPTRGTGGLALTLVKLTGRRGNLLTVEGLDLDDGTPLLDIKPYFAHRDRSGPTR